MPDPASQPDSTPDSEVEFLFHQATELTDPVEQAAFLDRVCASRPELRTRLLRLLAADRAAAAYLQREGRLPDAARTTPDLKAFTIAEGPGSIIGNYKLLERLGEGGMGVVYLAEQTRPFVKRVALKIIKLGMDTRQVVARFEAERQALALMSHPNIAHVIEGGATETGRPYFVMELVKGLPITEYCDRHNLNTRERLELFLPVCQAVQHAHQKGIIHRDLKPSNVLVMLVDGRPTPVVIDFGVAKAINQRLTEKTLFTKHGQFIGTVAYVAPEQANPKGMDVDTRTDVYSLGVMLYELLIGRTPFDKESLLSKGFDEIYRIISEEEPPRPSTRLSSLSGEERTRLARHRRIDPRHLGLVLRGDMDWIVMKALEKDRNRRYETPTSLGDDIKRYLAGETVSAVAPSTGYKLRKFVRRNRATVTAISAVFIALVLGVIGTTWQAVEAVRARARADEARREAEEVIRFLNEMLEEVRPERAVGKDTAMLKALLEKTAARVEVQLKDQPNVAFRLLSTMGRTYEALGAFTNAEPMQRRALVIARERYGDASTNVASQLLDLGLTLQWRGIYGEASNLVAEALATSLRLQGDGHPLTARARHRLGSIEQFTGDTAAAEQNLTNALAVQKRVLGDNDPATLHTGRDLAALYFEEQRFTEMEPVILGVLDAQRRINGPEHPDTLRALELLGLLRMQQGRYVEAEKHFTELVATRRRILPPTHAHLLTSMDYLAMVYSFEGEYAKAEALCREAVATIATTEGLETERALVYRSNLAEYVRNQGRYAESERMFREMMAVQDRVLAPNHLNRFETQNSLSVQYVLQGRLAEAETLARSCLQGRRDLARLATNDTRLGDALSQLVLVLLLENKFAPAEPFARQCLTNRLQAPVQDWRLPVAQSQLGGTLLGLGRDAESEPLLTRGYDDLKQLRERIPAIDRSRLVEAGERLLQRYRAQSNQPRAAALENELIPIRLWAGIPGSP